MSNPTSSLLNDEDHGNDPSAAQLQQDANETIQNTVQDVTVQMQGVEVSNPKLGVSLANAF
jgi:hypothetical protein